MKQIPEKPLSTRGLLPSDIDGDVPISVVMEQLDAIEREATHSDYADATLNVIVGRIRRFRRACVEDEA